jgi:alkylation response protein AidB-like acyl-CoA dehydrogenase
MALWPLGDPEEFRGALRTWLGASWAPTITVRQWWARLASEGLSVPTWAATFGGLGATTNIQQVIEDELADLGAIGPPLGGAGVRTVGPALRQHAGLEQATRMVVPIVMGSECWCELVEEPHGDLRALTTRAINADAGGWAIEGVKSATSMADQSDRALLVARTEPGSTGAKGLTCLAVRLDRPGVSVHQDADGVRTVVFDGLLVDRADAVGAIGDGWSVARTILAHSGSSLAGRIRRGVVTLTPGSKAGNLDRRVGDVLAVQRPNPRRRPPSQ